MATVRQVQVIEDLEAAAAAVQSEKIAGEKITIQTICDRSGHMPQTFRPLAETLEKNGDWALLRRLKRAFIKGGKVPSWLDHVDAKIEAPAPEVKEPDLPPTAGERMQQITNSAIAEGNADDDEPVLKAFQEMVKALAPLSRNARERVITTTSHFYGVWH